MEQMIGGPYVSLACSPSRAARVLLRVQIGTWLFHCFARSLAASEVILKSTKIDLRNKDGRRKREREREREVLSLLPIRYLVPHLASLQLWSLSHVK